MVLPYQGNSLGIIKPLIPQQEQIRSNLVSLGSVRAMKIRMKYFMMSFKDLKLTYERVDVELAEPSKNWLMVHPHSNFLPFELWLFK